ncbi:MAG: peptide/nickel transport system substrate-binding protein [Thermomicrobiales bacterium]|nr:peptide/nickel transport system substrate-binding protein [Thermomicrobiales bacterium]
MSTLSRRSFFIAATILLLLSPVLMLTRPAAAQDRPVLRFGTNSADLSTLDPHFASGTQDRTVVDMVFDGLVRFKPGDASVIEPDLATAVPDPVMEGDKQTWTFTLRDNVMCHPWQGGEAYALTADDVVYSLQKSANKDTSGYAADYAGMTVAKVDDKTVKITMDAPLSPTLFLPKVANYNGGFIVCSKAVEGLGLEGFKTQPVGTGPFMFTSYTPQTSVILTANDQYFRGAPKLGGVEVRYMPDATSRELALQSGELDAASGVNEAQWVDRINAEGTLKADVFGPGEVAFMNLNIENEYLSKPQVRQAIAYAIDREEHQALYGSPVSEVVYSVVPAALMPGGLTQEQAAAAGVEYPRDVEKAKQLLAEAGYPDGFKLTLVTSEMPAYRANYEVLQSELAEIGIEIELQVVDHATMHSQIREDVNPIVIYVAFRPNADVYLTQFFYSPSIVVKGASPVTNFSHYSAIDDLILQARAETDPAAQEELWRQANTQILKDVAAVPLQYQNQVYARSQKVDYGHELVKVLALYPGIDETTTIAP